MYHVESILQILKDYWIQSWSSSVWQLLLAHTRLWIYKLPDKVSANTKAWADFEQPLPCRQRMLRRTLPQLQLWWPRAVWMRVGANGEVLAYPWMGSLTMMKKTVRRVLWKQICLQKTLQRCWVETMQTSYLSPCMLKGGSNSLCCLHLFKPKSPGRRTSITSEFVILYKSLTKRKIIAKSKCCS